MPMSFSLGNILKINYEIRRRNHCRFVDYHYIGQYNINILI